MKRESVLHVAGHDRVFALKTLIPRVACEPCHRDQHTQPAHGHDPEKHSIPDGGANLRPRTGEDLQVEPVVVRQDDHDVAAPVPAGEAGGPAAGGGRGPFRGAPGRHGAVQEGQRVADARDQQGVRVRPVGPEPGHQRDGQLQQHDGPPGVPDAVPRRHARSPCPAVVGVDDLEDGRPQRP